jgi:hypothetical protein
MNEERNNGIQFYSPNESEFDSGDFKRRANGGVQNYDEVSPLVLTYEKTDHTIPNQNQDIESHKAQRALVTQSHLSFFLVLHYFWWTNKSGGFLLTSYY